MENYPMGDIAPKIFPSQDISDKKNLSDIRTLGGHFK